MEASSLHISCGIALFVGQPAMLTRSPLLFLFEGEVDARKRPYRYCAATYGGPRPSEKGQETREKAPKKGKEKESKRRKPLRLSTPQETVALKGQVEKAEPQVSKRPNNARLEPPRKRKKEKKKKKPKGNIGLRPDTPKRPSQAGYNARQEEPPTGPVWTFRVSMILERPGL